jgi:hypothetical protein
MILWFKETFDHCLNTSSLLILYYLLFISLPPTMSYITTQFLIEFSLFDKILE